LQAETIRRVHRWLRKLRVPRRDRSDLGQDVLLAAFTSLGSYDPARGSAARWLNAITVHAAAHYHAKVSHRHETITDPGELCNAGGSLTAVELILAEELLLAEETRNVLTSVILELPVELRSLLIQHDLHEVPMSEVAEASRLPLSTAYK
jgi:RNA polymerase sigma-70 factor (ECF subfamily)